MKIIFSENFYPPAQKTTGDSPWRLHVPRGYLFIATVLAGGFLFFSQASAKTEVIGTLLADEHWTLAGSPYVIKGDAQTGGLSVALGATLTIDPGVVVKFERNTQMVVGGSVIAHGTVQKPVIFTSLFDDASDGQDTDGLGPTTGSVGDWYRISGGDPVIDFDHIEMRYSNLGLDFIFTTQSLSLTNSLLHHNSHAIKLAYIANGPIIENNTIRDNGRAFAFLVMYDAFNFIRNNNIYNNQVYGGENLTPGFPVDMSHNWWGDASGPFNATSNPQGQGNPVSDGVLFDPWLGSKVVIEPQRIDPAIIIPGILGSEQKNGEFVIDPILHTYDDLIDTLKANGYIEGQNLFPFPYDWRRSNTETALLLENKINKVQDICQCDKVDLVAHSMGGLVARQYIQSDRYGHDVDQLIFLGTPHLGSLDSYLTWEGGVFKPSTFSFLTQYLFSKEAKKQGFSSIFDYVRNKPISSVQELLPMFDYLRDKQTSIVRTYPNNYSRNVFLEDLNTNLTILITSGVNVTNITADDGLSDTITKFRVIPPSNPPLWFHGYPEGFLEKIGDRGLETGIGDGTVPQNSSQYITEDLNTVSSAHLSLPTKSEGLIFKKLTGNDPAVLVDKGRALNLKMLILKMLSPADMQVIAPDGKHIGKDFVTGQEVNEIPDAFYSGFLTDNEFITILNPLDGAYKIETQGTGNGGEYTVSVGYISDNTLVDKDFTAQTQPNLVEELNLSVDNSNPQNLQIQPKDVTPPEITIRSPQAKDYLRSELLPINIQITDLESGVLSSEIKFGDTIVNNNQSIDLFFKKLGTHKVSVKALDLLSNIGNASVSFRVIATLQSTISDAQRAYSLGWITDPTVRDSLIAKLQVAIKQGKLDKVTAKSFMSLLDAQRNKSINEQAYQLLKEDINWLLNN